MSKYFRFWTFCDKEGEPIMNYVRAKDKQEAIEKAVERWSDVDPNSCEEWKGVL